MARGVRAAKAAVKKDISAGFLIRSKGYFLLCHATKPYGVGPQQFDSNWTISKGMVEPNESPIKAATRELKEETNIDLEAEEFKDLIPPQETEPLTTYSTGKKNVQVYLIDDVVGKLKDSKVQLKCNSIIEGNKGQPAMNGFPEMDSFMWVDTYETASKMVFKSQKFMFAENYVELRLKAIAEEKEKLLNNPPPPEASSEQPSEGKQENV